MNYIEKLGQKRVVVTGATGFIGGEIVTALMKTDAEVTVILRSRHGRERFLKDGIKVVTSGLKDGDALKGTLNSADVLFNFAYDVRASGDDNLAAFTTLLGAAKAAGVKRIVHASSIVVYDDWPNGDLTEESPISTTSGGAYRQTKIKMERILEASGIPAAILQPTLVYGPRSALWTDRIINQLKSGPVILPVETGLCNAVYGADVAQAALRAAVVDRLVFERFIVSGSVPIDWSDFYLGYQKISGEGEIVREPLETLRSRFGPLQDKTHSPIGPTAAARLSAHLRFLIGNNNFQTILNLVKRFRTKGNSVYPDRNGLQLLAGQGACDISKATEQLGYEPDYDFVAGLDEIAKLR